MGFMMRTGVFELSGSRYVYVHYIYTEDEIKAYRFD